MYNICPQKTGWVLPLLPLTRYLDLTLVRLSLGGLMGLRD
jgi:hypothetical protein